MASRQCNKLLTPTQAIDELRADKLAAIAEFNRNNPRFRDRDLFVFCFNRSDGRITAHEAFVGWDVRTLHDAGLATRSARTCTEALKRGRSPR